MQKHSFKRQIFLQKSKVVNKNRMPKYHVSLLLSKVYNISLVVQRYFKGVCGFKIVSKVCNKHIKGVYRFFMAVLNYDGIVLLFFGYCLSFFGCFLVTYMMVLEGVSFVIFSKVFRECCMKFFFIAQNKFFEMFS